MNAKQNDDRIRVSVEEAKQRYDQGEATILDVVDSHSYAEISYQVKDAVRIDPENISDDFTRLPKDRAVFAY